jgi:glutamine synthetase
MREEGGYKVIEKAIENLKVRHEVHIAYYGKGNDRRLTGQHETADIKTFKSV